MGIVERDKQSLVPIVLRETGFSPVLENAIDLPHVYPILDSVAGEHLSSLFVLSASTFIMFGEMHLSIYCDSSSKFVTARECIRCAQARFVVASHATQPVMHTNICRTASLKQRFVADAISHSSKRISGGRRRLGEDKSSSHEKARRRCTGLL